MADPRHQILLYYKYTHIDDPAGLVAAQRELCTRLGLTGRILIAHEGINGTLEGLVENTEEYITAMKADSRFADIHWKKSEGTGSAFPKLSIRARAEIVSSHLGEKDIDPTKITGTYLQAEELHDWIHSDKEFYIVDMRNDYEYRIGNFENSLLPKLQNYRDLAGILPELEHLRGKTVVTVCTGGVRCEKASGFLVANGFSDVYQLYGGIVTYMEKYPNEDFKGKLYVFDGRIAMAFNESDPAHTLISACEACEKPSARYVNCADNTCHETLIICETCCPDGKALCVNGCK